MLDLVDVMRDLRTQLIDAMKEAEGEPLRFEVGSVDVELSVAAKQEKTGKAGIRFYVFELGAEVQSGSASTQKLTFNLNPRVAATGASPEITGPSVPGER
jgi:hypothetical protein